MVVERLRRPTTALGLSLAAAITAIGAALADLPVLALISGIMSALSAVAQFRSSGAVSFPFDESSWNEAGDSGFVISIPRKRHGKTSPVTEVHGRRGDEGFQVVFTDVHTRPDGTVDVKAAGCFAGEIRIT